MKTTLVPAQITTVEDKIAAGLSLTQLFLIAAPFFGGSAVYVLLPPFFHASNVKLSLVALLVVGLPPFAIRIKDMLVVQWSILFLRYSLRPAVYVFQKHKPYERSKDMHSQPILETEVVTIVSPALRAARKLSFSEQLRAEQLIETVGSGIKFKANKKGLLHVYLTQDK